MTPEEFFGRDKETMSVDEYIVTRDNYIEKHTKTEELSHFEVGYMCAILDSHNNIEPHDAIKEMLGYGSE